MKVCPKCGAIWDGDRWVPEPDKKLLDEFSKKQHCAELCPGDMRLEKRQVEGVVTFKGKFLESHRDDINNLVARVARDGRRRNVAARVFQTVEENDSLLGADGQGGREGLQRRSRDKVAEERHLREGDLAAGLTSTGR